MFKILNYMVLIGMKKIKQPILVIKIHKRLVNVTTSKQES